MTLSQTLAGIAWDPDLRGALSVIVGVVVLMGSVYLILATNLASRLGFLVAAAGLMGWMTILGLFWWIAPSETGPAGDPPGWRVEEINTGNLPGATLPEARLLDGAQLPPPEDIDELPTEQFEQVAADLEDELGGWSLLSPSDPSRGEAQSTAEEALLGEAYPTISSADDFEVLYGMEMGGKPERDGDGLVDRVTNRVANTFKLAHPSHYAVIQVQPAIFQETVPGEAPPTPEADPNADVISVVMVRDIGERRLPVAITTIVSGALFALLCYMLHVRDKSVQANRSAPLPEPAPANGNGSSKPAERTSATSGTGG